jgi:hypothetical protein
MFLYLVEPQWDGPGFPALVEVRCAYEDIGATINSLYGSLTGYYVIANLDRLVY